MTERRTKPDWSNPHAEIVRRVSEADATRIRLKPEQPKDKVFGPVRETILRYLARIGDIHQEMTKVVELFGAEHDTARKARYYTIADDLERELEVVVGLYTELFEFEPTLRDKWSGPPIFSVREGGVAVIADREMQAYHRHIRQPTLRPVFAHNLYRAIALNCLRTD